MTEWIRLKHGSECTEHHTNLNRSVIVSVPEGKYGVYMRLKSSDDGELNSDVSAYLSPWDLDTVIIMLIEAKMRSESGS